MIEAPAREVLPGAIPWQAEPRRAWSLLEMLVLYAGSFAGIARALEYTKWCLLAPAKANGQAAAAHKMAEILPSLESFPLSLSFKEQAKRLVGRLKGEGGYGVDALVLCVEELQDNFRSELDQHAFLWIVESRREMFGDPLRWFGEKPANKYQSARRDMRDCVRCFVLEQWSASVFHAMGVIEYGLRDLAARVHVPMTAQIEMENWHNIIEGVEKQVKAMKQLPKSQQDPIEISFCASAASHFFAVKEAWRNHVAHVRGRYDEDEATRIITNVRDFMRAMAA